MAREAIREVPTTAELARKHDVQPTMVSDWKRTAIGNMAPAFGGQSAAEPRIAPSVPAVVATNHVPRSASRPELFSGLL